MNLSHIELFRGIQEEEIAALLKCLGAHEKQFKKGETIFLEGRPIESLGIVLSGMVLISYIDIWGNTSILGSASEGEVFGEAYAAIPGEPLPLSVVCAKDATILFLHVGRAMTMCERACPYHTRLIKNLLSVCARKNLQLSRRIQHTSSKSIRGRLLSYFSDCAKTAGKSTFMIPYKRQELANYLNVDRSAMCNELSKMQKEGLIEYSGNSFSLKL